MGTFQMHRLDAEIGRSAFCRAVFYCTHLPLSAPAERCELAETDSCQVRAGSRSAMRVASLGPVVGPIHRLFTDQPSSSQIGCASVQTRAARGLDLARYKGAPSIVERAPTRGSAAHADFEQNVAQRSSARRHPGTELAGSGIHLVSISDPGLAACPSDRRRDYVPERTLRRGIPPRLLRRAT
jgi:hypothetical protein